MRDPDPRLFIYRPPTADDTAVIRNVQAALEDVETFQPIGEPHLTIFNNPMTAQLGGRALQKLVYPIPDEAKEAIELPVKSVEIYHRKWRSSIAVTLDDPQQRFYRDHSIFRQRLREGDGRDWLSLVPSPHVTLGRIAPEYAISDVHELVRALLPASLRFEAAIFEPLPPEPEASKLDIKPRSLAITDIPVRTIKPGGIPSGFLAALQRTAVAGS